MHIVKGSHFEIESTSFPTIVGVATTDPDKEGFFQAEIYNSIYPLGETMKVIESAPSRMISSAEFNEFKADLEKRAAGRNFSSPKSPTISRKKS